MMWFKSQGKPLGDEDPNLPVPQADGDDGSTVLPEPETRMEPYPQLNSIQQDEAIAWLKGVVAGMDKRIEALDQRIEFLEKSTLILIDRLDVLRDLVLLKSK